MILYALIMAAAAIPLLGVAIALFRGNPGMQLGLGHVTFHLSD